MPFDELRAQLAMWIAWLRQHIEDQPDPDTAYAQATQFREQLQAASEEAAMLRALTVRRIQEARGLSVAGVGQHIGLTKARAQDMLEKAKNQQLPVPTTPPPSSSLSVKRTRRIPPRGAGSGSSFAEEMRKLGHEPSTELVQAEAIRPPDAIAKRLELSGGEDVLIRKRQMFADGEPVQLASSYIPMSIAGSVDLAYPDTGPTGIYTRLADRGHKAVRFAEEVEARYPSRDETAFLRISPPDNVLEVTRLAYDRVGRPLEVVVNVFPANLWRLGYEWNAGDD
jgi:DNA-binding GntR family transcriptional regulator